MREILFRGKLKSGGDWVCGDWVCGDLVRLRDGQRTMTYIYGCGEVDPGTVCEYAGLTDRNGKKIFEGDILTATENENTTVYKVVFMNGIFGLAVKNGGYDCPVVLWAQNCIEVTGNIYDNPELLKGVEE